MSTKPLLAIIAAVLATVVLPACGSAGQVVSTDTSKLNVDRASASPTKASLVGDCNGERYARRHLPSKYSHVLRNAGWKYFGAWARVGQVAVVNVVYAHTVDSHQRAVIFVHGRKIIGADAAGPFTSHFDARICAVGGHSAVTGYVYRLWPAGPDRQCPRPRPAFATVHWQVNARHATPLDHIPGLCR